MRAKLGLLAAGFGLLLPALAHHSFEAEYDSSKSVTLTGVVTKFEWTNPHARFYIDVKDENGNVTNWNLELASPNVLMRQGWTRHALKEGDQITVKGFLAKDASKMANAREVTTSEGKRIFAGAAAEAAPPKQ